MALTLTCAPPPFAYAANGQALLRGFSRATAPMNRPPSTPETEERDLADARLMSRVSTGDQRAFAELYDRFSRPLYATALRVLNDPAEAQDIVHDVFVTLWEKAASFETSRGTAFGWTVTLVRHRAIDRLRMRRRRAEILADSLPSDLGYHEDNLGPATGDSATRGDQATTVRSAVATLPTEQKRALELAFFSGLTQLEIAEKLQQPLGTVKARIRRGLLKLRDTIAPRL